MNTDQVKQRCQLMPCAQALEKGESRNVLDYTLIEWSYQKAVSSLSKKQQRWRQQVNLNTKV